MENWGLAIYLENNFLFTPGVSSQSVEGAVVRIIAHEISHMVCSLYTSYPRLRNRILICFVFFQLFISVVW